MAETWVPVDAPADGASAGPNDADDQALAADARDPNVGRGWDIAMGINLGFLGIMFLSVIASTIMSAVRGSDGTGQIDAAAFAAAMWAQNGLFVVTLGAIPFLWAVYTRVGRWRGALAYFQLHRPLLGVAQGGLTLIGLYVIVAIIMGVASLLDPGLLENPQLEAIGAGLTWPLVIATSLVAGITEELFFRGYLQRTVGMWGQAVLFGITHAGYGTVLQIVVPFVIGIGFGYMVRRGITLWAPITAHVLFDVVSLSIAKVCSAPEAATAVCG